MHAEAHPPDVEWPRQPWFLRGPLLNIILMGAAIAALVTEFSIMLISREWSFGYVGLLLSGMGLLVLFRARWVGLALTTAGSAVCALLAVEFVGVWTVTVFAMFLFAKQAGRVLLAAGMSAAVLYIVLVIRDGGDFESPPALVAATFCVAAAAAGSVIRLQSESWDAARQRAADLAATQAGELRRAVTDERMRIARDLHDIIGHELAVVNINVGVAEISLPAEADGARAALTSAREGLQRTLQETQQILDLLRDAGGDTDRRSELALVEYIPALVERMANAGAPIDAHVAGDLPELDADVSSAAYRIVQEALTNAGKYGTGAARVAVTSQGDRVIIDVENSRAAVAFAADARTGYGLVGMRERAHSAGGTIEITQTGMRFRVHVELPTTGSAE
ncbi:sensor histidine kinase [Microbacterium sp. cx-59]|uniref:sensor histidine kinase n=1 Tax=Microbacterium sp. cx-59 TaxID=2891207 RepID=UPI001E2CB6D5|nr:histidine kinase [Microbacterium sp. cx-59]MCC4908389.1 histidine kinase [Microbacterium sp. cx-59]